ncbi:MAG: EAL domain-containing protein [Mariprofundus sp.]
MNALKYLKDLPIDELKIDQSFINAMDRDKTSLTIVKMVTRMAHSLDLEVTAEGVESEQDWRELKSMGCDRVQGFYTGKPMPSEAFEQWLLESPWGNASIRRK